MSDHIPSPAAPTVVARVATRLRMTEGQVYTVVLTALAVLLLSLTGLPTAHRTSHDGGTVVPAPPAEAGP